MIYLSTTNELGFIYYFGIFYLKIGKFYTFFQLGKGPVMGPIISPGKSLHVKMTCVTQMMLHMEKESNPKKVCVAHKD